MVDSFLSIWSLGMSGYLNTICFKLITVNHCFKCSIISFYLLQSHQEFVNPAFEHEADIPKGTNRRMSLTDIVEQLKIEKRKENIRFYHPFGKSNVYASFLDLKENEVVARKASSRMLVWITFVVILVGLSGAIIVMSGKSRSGAIIVMSGKPRSVAIIVMFSKPHSGDIIVMSGKSRSDAIVVMSSPFHQQNQELVTF